MLQGSSLFSNDHHFFKIQKSNQNLKEKNSQKLKISKNPKIFFFCFKTNQNSKRKLKKIQMQKRGFSKNYKNSNSKFFQNVSFITNKKWRVNYLLLFCHHTFMHKRMSLELFQLIYNCMCIGLLGLIFNFERTIYSHSPPVLLRVTINKVLNPNSIPSENYVSCERHWFLKGLRWTILHIPLAHKYWFPRIFAWRGSK